MLLQYFLENKNSTTKFVYDLVGPVGKKLRFLEAQKPHGLNLGILCTLFIILFKVNSKSIPI